MAAEVHPDVAAFAAFMKGEEQKERDAKRAAREERQQADATKGLVAAKDAAAAEVKRLRGREGVTAEERAAADAAYREALAAVVAAETGEAPAWAPPAAEPEAEAPADDAPADDAPADTAPEDTPSDDEPGDEAAADA